DDAERVRVAGRSRRVGRRTGDGAEEERAQHGDADGTADLVHRGEHASRGARVASGDAGEDHVDQDRRGQTEPEAADEEGEGQLPVPRDGAVPGYGHSRVPAARNYWEFPATPIDAEVIGVIGAAISRRHVRRADRTGEGEPTTLTLEPHHLVVWAGRWYLVAFEPEADRWRAMRVDRLTPRMPTGRTFDRRPVPHGDPATFVMTTYDRGDTPAEWPCRGSALLALPASLVARFAPGGSTVEHVTDSTCRLTLGAWSWAGVAGLLLTFDADLAETEPAEVGQALHALRARIDRGIGPAGR